MSKSCQSICLPLHGSINNLITTRGNSEQYVLSFVEDLLPRSDAKSVSEELKKNFILNKIGRRCTEKRLREKQTGEYISARRRMPLGLSKARSMNGIKYSDLLPLNVSWENYMRETLGNEFFSKIPRDPCDPNWDGINRQLTKADFHGAKILVVRSRCPSLVGKEGIVVRDTKNILTICERNDIVRAIPKRVVEIQIYLRDVTLRVLGRQLSIRPTERTVKKFKQTRTIDL